MKLLPYFLISLSFGLLACTDSLIEENAKGKMTSEGSQEIVENRKNKFTKSSTEIYPDFKNFTYPGFCAEGYEKPFKLKDGVFEDKEHNNKLLFAYTKYVDVTGDNIEEAFVVLSIVTGGSSSPSCVYIFTTEDRKSEKVKLIWDFQTGDRAYGGLADIYGEDGNLVVERFATEEGQGACCPKYYRKETYQWENGKFKLLEKKKFPTPDRGEN